MGKATTFPSFAIFLTAFLFAAILPAPSSAQTYTVLYSFTGGDDGAFPIGGLILDHSGNLYGTTFGKAINYGAGTTAGSIFEITPNGQFTLLHSFGAGWAGGGWPAAGLVQDPSGNLYGTCAHGGAFDGTVFKLDTSGNFGVLYSFKGGRDGADPEAPLILDPAGNLYGTTAGGGTPYYDNGTIFRIATLGKHPGKEKVLHRFSSPRKFGLSPEAPVLMDTAGNLFGTAAFYGPKGGGTVFKLSPTGVITLVHAFGRGSDSQPESSLIQDALGNLYGTDYMTVYKLDAQGNETILLWFNLQNGFFSFHSGVIMDSAGNFYGTTYEGGNWNACLENHGDGCGVVYKLDPFGDEAVLYQFSGGTDGGNPASGVITDSAGNLYGTTTTGGIVNSACPYGCGVVFKITP